jgi:hypothetical protein
MAAWVERNRWADQPVEYLPFNALELDAVILGCAMNDECRVSLKHLAGSLYPNTRVLQATKSEREFKLVIHD